MSIRMGHSSIITGCAKYVVLVWICILYVGISARTFQKESLGTNRTTLARKSGFRQKKPRSAQYGFMPRLQAVYPRHSVPVRLATIPVSGGYRVPITSAQRIPNVAPLAPLPSLQRTYVPIINSLPSIRYPMIQQGELANRYVVPYTLRLPAPRLTSTGQYNEDIGKHYNEKYNTLPTISNMDLAQDGLNLGGKTESKKLDIGDDFDNFLESLDGPCSKNPCKNGAKCRISRDGISFHCICTRGYKGKTCEDKNACFPNPCENSGECTLTSEGFECSCPKGFQGKKCERENTCEPNPCQNEGVCTELKNGGFECICKKGYFGDKCQVSKRGCDPNPCHNDGQCTERDNGGYECVCSEGYTGTNCDRPNNKCFMNPCKNGGSCMQTMTSLGYECACPRGFRGTNCEDHSGCDVATCQNGGTCYETEFGVRCICKNGYSGDKCQIRKFCEADTCQNNGKCIEHVSGFRCICSEGYKGKMCDEIDRCRPNPCQHGGHCEQSDSGYFCKCSAQYQGPNCEVSNPCSSNPCKNGGKCASALDGQQYQCQCLDGYLGTNCEERNVCAPNPCENNGVCRKNGAEFLCECQDGFEGKTCGEKDPCRNNPCQNNGVCKRNGNDDFTCSCPEDYKGMRCEVKRHCHPNPCMNDGVCEESDDDFTCSCKEGFRGQRCQELDQCAPNPCRNGGRCVSVGHQGNKRGFVCECANSFFGDKCEERNPCHPNPCANNGKCTEINGGFTCQCSAGYKGDRCHEIDKCNPNPCQHQGSCTEVIGGLGYACKCAYGYKGQDCEKKDYCHPNPCDHDGQCTPNEAGFHCKCAPGFMGQRCTESNPCEPNPCQHNSQCVLLPGFGKNHECNCSIGWSGDTCQKREICQPNPCQFGTKCVETGEDSYSCVKSMCHPNPCQNNGKCINVNENNFQCACTAGFEGGTCEVPRRQSQLSLVPTSPPVYSQLSPNIPANTPPSVQLAKSSPRVIAPELKSSKQPSIPMSAIASCSPFLCQNGGVCVQEEGKSIRCKCPPMYTGDTCELNKCHDNPCQNNGTCLPVEREPGFVCKCRDGLTGPLCSRKPCEPNPCKNNGQCVMFYSIYLCKCKTGFQGKLCEESTSGNIAGTETEPKEKTKPTQQTMIMKDNQAISPCNPSPCKNNAQCLETSDGEFECICPLDFSGPRCEDKGQYEYSSAPKFFPGDNEECKHCDMNARCVSGHCVCKNKYVGDGLECWERTKKDEDWTCSVNPCKNGGTCKKGRSGCVCRLGFVGDYCEEFSPPVVHLTFDKLSVNNRLMDMSGYGNDAIANYGFQIAAREGKCGNAGNLLGGDILFDGEHFQSIPRQAITIAVWVKLMTALGIQSIFDTVGSHSSHRDGQYHFEIDNGRVRWFHRNEAGQTVFSVVTDQIAVREGNWTLVTGTYSADKNRARIYVNGDMIKEAKGNKMTLSQDWGLKAGIGKHEHRYGARVLRGMVDEFSIFPSELSRLQILVLMKHCKVYYNRYNKKTSTVLQESFTGIKPNAPVVQSFTQPAESNAPQSYQNQYGYHHESISAPTKPQLSSNVPPIYNYQSGFNPISRGQSYDTNGYYGNQQSTTREQAGYQRSQAFKQPSVRPNLAGYARTAGGPKMSPYVTGLPSYVTQSPSYVPKSPSYTRGSFRAGIPTTFQQTKYVPSSKVTYHYNPESSYRVPQTNRGYLKSYTPQSLVTPPYSPQWYGSRQDQLGYARTQTPVSPDEYRDLSYNPRYQPSAENYDGYATRRNQDPSSYYAQGGIFTGNDGTQTGITLQGQGYTRNGVYSPATSNTPYNTISYQIASTNTASQGNRYSDIPQTAQKSQYNPAEYTGNIPPGQYQSIVPTGGQQNGQYEPQALNNEYSPRTKSSIPQSNYQSNQNPTWKNDVTGLMTASGDVTRTSYANALPSTTQNAYPRNNVYANNLKTYEYNPVSYMRANILNSAETPVSQQYTSPYTGQSYAYPAGSSIDHGALRANIPRPKSPRVNQKAQSVHLTKQNKAQSQKLLQNARLIQGQLNGPIKNQNKLPKINKLDENGQYPSDMKTYKDIAKIPTKAFDTGTMLASYMRVKQPAYTRNGNSWSTRAQTPTDRSQWSSDEIAKIGSYDGWSQGMQTQKPGDLWTSRPVTKLYTQVGWPRQKAGKNFRYGFNMPYTTSYNRARTSSLVQFQRRRQQPRSQRLNNRQNWSKIQRTAKTLAIDEPNVYKRTRVTSKTREANTAVQFK